MEQGQRRIIRRINRGTEMLLKKKEGECLRDVNEEEGVAAREDWRKEEEQVETANPKIEFDF